MGKMTNSLEALIGVFNSSEDLEQKSRNIKDISKGD